MRWAAIIVACLLLGLLLRYTAMHVYLELNTDRIAKNLCVEREVAQSTCAGSCHKAKAMNALETPHEEQAPSPMAWLSEETMPFTDQAERYIPTDDRVSKASYARYAHGSFDDVLLDVNLPPPIPET